ncbi:phosphoadenosine phosphosulfate reductase family protein [Acidithiobacillus ferrivorans]|nr:phosphoadenosine phosphosulfate reductase family protein [Acidithiobacillus ferrivorans]
MFDQNLFEEIDANKNIDPPWSLQPSSSTGAGGHMDYQLPGQVGDTYVIPVSGGADSAALAVFLVQRFPETPWKLVFTDTLHEPPSTYESLDRLESYLGISITRIMPAKGLFALIAGFNGFLPSGQDRYCTRILKTEPFEKWVKSIRHGAEAIWSFVGIRADEERTGLISRLDFIQTVMPFSELGMVRQDIYDILAGSIGIPGLYRDKTRSGCQTCPFQRKSEVMALARREPQVFLEGARMEKVETTHQIESEWIGQFIFPVFNDLKCGVASKKGPHRKSGNIVDLFRSHKMEDWFVGVEFFINPNVGSDGVWWQDIVTIGSSVSATHRELAGHYHHRIATSRVLPWELEPKQMRDELRLAVFHLQTPKGLIPAECLQKSDFTWRKGDSYNGIFARLHSVQRLFIRVLGGDAEAQSFVINRWLFTPPEKPEEAEENSVCLACSN